MLLNDDVMLILLYFVAVSFVMVENDKIYLHEVFKMYFKIVAKNCFSRLFFAVTYFSSAFSPPE